jgi:hypothetical protein
MILGTHAMSTWFYLQNWVWQKWYQSCINRRNASLERRVISLVVFWVFAKIFYSNLSPLFWFTKSNLNGYLLSFLLFSRWQGSWQRGSTFAHHHIKMSCLWSPIAMVSMLATSWGLYGHCSWSWDIASPHFSLVSWGCFVGTRTFVKVHLGP